MSSVQQRPTISSGRAAWTALAAAGFVAGVLFGPSFATAAEKVTQVFVTNLASDPVPVHEQGTANVNVTNDRLTVNDGQAPALQPFRAVSRVRPNATGFQQGVTTVPAGKRLVVEHVSWDAYAATGSEFAAARLRVGELGPAALYLPIGAPHASAIAGLVLQDGSEPTRLYFDPGDEIWVFVGVTDPTGAEFNLILSGYLFDL